MEETLMNLTSTEAIKELQPELTEQDDIQPKRRGRKPKVAQPENCNSEQDVLAAKDDTYNMSDSSDVVQSDVGIDSSVAHTNSIDVSGNLLELHKTVYIKRQISLYKSPSYSGYVGKVSGYLIPVETLRNFTKIRVRVPEIGIISGYVKSIDLDKV